MRVSTISCSPYAPQDRYHSLLKSIEFPQISLLLFEAVFPFAKSFNQTNYSRFFQFIYEPPPPMQLFAIPLSMKHRIPTFRYYGLAQVKILDVLPAYHSSWRCELKSVIKDILGTDDYSDDNKKADSMAAF